MNISRYKNIISDINNQDSYNENKNNYTYTNNMIKFGNFQCTMMGMFPSWITSEKQFP